MNILFLRIVAALSNTRKANSALRTALRKRDDKRKRVLRRKNERRSILSRY